MAASSAVHVFRRASLFNFSTLSSSTRVFRQKYAPLAIFQCKRTLFSDEILGLDGFQRQRLMINDKLGDLREKFFIRMNEVVNLKEGQTIFTDDLKTIVYIVNNDEELSLMKDMLLRYCKESAVQRYNKYIFGPVVFRLLHILNKPELALELFLDESISSNFDQIASYTILMDMLFESKRYEDVKNIYKEINKRALNSFVYPGDCTTVMMATYFEINSQQSLEECKALLVDCNEANANISNRGIIFASMLALNQKEFGLALEMIATRNDHFNFVLKNIKGISYCHLDRIENSFPILQSILQYDTPYKSKQMKVFPNLLCEMNKKLESSNHPVLKQQLKLIEQSLKVAGLISDVPLEDFVRQTIVRAHTQQNSFKSRQRSFIKGYRSRHMIEK